MAAAHISIQCDSSALVQALSALGDLAKLPLEIRERLVGLLDFDGDVGSFDIHRLVTARTVDYRVLLEPSELLLDLVAAVRAG